MDQHMVPDYPIIDWSDGPVKISPFVTWMAGDSSHHVTIEVRDGDREMTIGLQTMNPKKIPDQ